MPWTTQAGTKDQAGRRGRRSSPGRLSRRCGDIAMVGHSLHTSRHRCLAPTAFPGDPWSGSPTFQSQAEPDASVRRRRISGESNPSS